MLKLQHLLQVIAIVGTITIITVVNIPQKEDMFNALEKVNLKDFVIKNGGLDYELTAGRVIFLTVKNNVYLPQSYSKKISIFTY